MTRPALALLASLALVAGTAGSASAASDTPPAMHLVARTSLPPGNSGTYGAEGEAQFMVDKNPADFGPHVDDQRSQYWSFQTKPGGFNGATGTAVTPHAGVRIYRAAAGVPVVYGDNAYDTWFGAGYAAGTDRLFEADAVRRTAEGSLAELTGQTQVPADLAERTVFYTKAELDQMLARLTPAGKAAIEGYSAGMDQRIKDVRADPTLLPIEYTLLTSLPRAWTVEDTLAAGVYITRDVASQGGLEYTNVQALLELEKKYGKAQGRAVFDDLYDEEDPKAVVTIHQQAFSNEPASEQTAAGRHAAFLKAAAYAETLPAALATGPGTGDSPVPSATPVAVPTQVKTSLSEVSAGLAHWVANLHGGSFSFAIAGNRTKSGHAMLVSEPQLDYGYPSLLYELEVHGGGYNARGVSVPGIPTVGIGYTGDVAWGLTTGYSKTIDSFIETTRPNPVSGGPTQYLHDGAWVDESCRVEALSYRTSAMGVPAGPSLGTQSSTICRTVHGPVVATSGNLARSVDYASWLHEDDTVDGILMWDRAKTLKDVEAGVKLLAWNENIVAADSAGNIGYWHPGRYLRRADGTDQRFPTPGTGAYDPKGFLPYAEMPHVIDPTDGYVANWNTKPAHGWVDGDLSGSTTRPGGPANRVKVIQDELASRTDFTPADLPRIDTLIGSSDMRAKGYLPLMLSIKGSTPAQTAALSLLAHWNRLAYDPGHGSSPLGTAAADVTDGPAPTLFSAFVLALRKQVYGSLPADQLAYLSALPAEGHQYDNARIDNLVLRVLRPGFSGLTPSRAWTGGRAPAVVVRAALVQALASLTTTYGASPSTWHRAHAISHLTSLTDVVGPTGIEQPFVDRGSWIHTVAFTTGVPYGKLSHVAPPKPVAPGKLPTTGLVPLLPLAALLLLGAALVLRRPRVVGPVRRG